MPASIKPPPWVGTATAVLSLLLAIGGSYVDNRARAAVLETRVDALEKENEALEERLHVLKNKVDVAGNGREKRLGRLEIMVCLIGSHLKVPGLARGDCAADP